MPEPLKDRFFNRDFYDDLGVALRQAHPTFDTQAFIEAIFNDGWQDRALMTWMRHTTQVLGDFLPEDFRAALHILYQAAHQMTAYGFENLIFSDYVATYGLDHWEASLPALERFTQLMSAEFAVRPFILQDQPRMMAQMRQWADHPHEAVRRLASEGCRPLLPWGMVLRGLKADPTPILPILEQLKADPSETVRRSVANNLNDIAKNQPDVVIDVTRRWSDHDGGLSYNSGTAWIIRHALRTLIKKANPEALAIIGYPIGGDFEVRNMMLTPRKIDIGGAVMLTFEIASTGDKPQNLMIDYIVYFMRANGKMYPKVFKLAKRELLADERVRFKKTHSFHPINTRRYYPGEHAIELQINGVIYGRAAFVVSHPDAN